MQNNPLYLRLKQIADDEGFTASQAEALTKEQAAGLLGISDTDITEAFFENMRTLLSRVLQSENDQAEMQKVKGTVMTDGFFKDKYPNAEFITGRIQDKPFITVWPDGEPIEVEE